MNLKRISIIISIAFLLILGLSFSSANAGVVENQAGSALFSQASAGSGEFSTNAGLLQACTPDTPDMIAYWPLDDGASATSFEDVIAGHNGSCTDPDCPASTTGIVDTAFLFNGIDKINVSAFSDIDWTSGDSFSVEAWVKIPATELCTENKVAVGRYEGSGQASWWLGCDGTDNHAAFSLRDNTGTGLRVVGTTPINDGNWHHLVGVRDASAGENMIYVDGAEETATSASYSASFASTHELNFGYMNANPYYYFPGSIDEIALYDRALSLDEIQDHYNGGDGQSYCAEPPVVTNPGDQINIVGDTVSLQIEASDPDSSTLTYSASGLPADLTIDSNSGLISGDIAMDAYLSSPYDVTVTVEDDSVPPLSSSVDFTWTVSPGNYPPVLVNPGPQADAEGDIVSLQVEASDPDEGDTLLYEASGLPDNLAIGSATGLISGTISYDASAGSPYTVTLSVTDDGLPSLTDIVTFTWTVTNTNRLPEVVNPGDQFNLPGESVSLQIEASDPDGDELTYAATGLPDALSINPATGVISGTVTLESVGTNAVEVVVSDGQDNVTIDFAWDVKYIELFLPNDLSSGPSTMK
ncbi:MAG: putative Ig domain-containing protein [Anaerolineales bacterium]